MNPIPAPVHRLVGQTSEGEKLKYTKLNGRYVTEKTCIKLMKKMRESMKAVAIQLRMLGHVGEALELEGANQIAREWEMELINIRVEQICSSLPNARITGPDEPAQGEQK